VRRSATGRVADLRGFGGFFWFDRAHLFCCRICSAAASRSGRLRLRVRKRTGQTRKGNALTNVQEDREQEGSVAGGRGNGTLGGRVVLGKQEWPRKAARQWPRCAGVKPI
jgi:hypothetical protein